MNTTSTKVAQEIMMQAVESLSANGSKPMASSARVALEDAFWCFQCGRTVEAAGRALDAICFVEGILSDRYRAGYALMKSIPLS